MSLIEVQNRLFTAAQVRELDRNAIEVQGIPGIVLMKRAGAAALNELVNEWGDSVSVTVFCGGGNNGGDGYIVAALAAQRNMAVRVVEMADTDKLSGDAKLARRFAEQAAVDMQPFSGSDFLGESVIVDAMLGTGFSGRPRESYAQAIAMINAAQLPVLAIDVPSGLNADTGCVDAEAVNADITVTFIGAKLGLFTGRGPACYGEVIYHSLDVPDAVYEQVEASGCLLDLEQLREQLPERPVDAHKNLFGHVLVIGGDCGSGGAAIMAAEAALRSGAGLVSLATRPQHVAAALARCPEIMVHGVESGQDLEPLLKRPTVLVVGPGLGQSPWGQQLLQKALAADLPTVLDADALNLLAAKHSDIPPHGGQWILTPHPGEAARLLETDNASVQRDRVAAIRQLCSDYCAGVILKGAGSLVAVQGDESVAVCPYGNPGMASGGMGDVLSGIVAALLAQGLAVEDAMALACCLHGAAGDWAAQDQGQLGMAATDLLIYLRRLLNGVET